MNNAIQLLPTNQRSSFFKNTIVKLMPKPLNEPAESQSFDGNWPSYYSPVVHHATLYWQLERFEW